MAGLALIGLLILKSSEMTAGFIWNLSDQGSWLFPIVFIAALLDSVHPCSFSILLITVALLFGLQMPPKKILQLGGIYIAGIFLAYLLIGLGLLQAFHLLGVPHFMGKLGAILLVLFGVINLLNRFFPNFPLKLKIPTLSHKPMARLLEQASVMAIFSLGLLVGICQFPCMGGPYLMVIGLLHDQLTYYQGFAYLVFYNLILIIPLVAVLLISSNQTFFVKVQSWKKSNLSRVRLWAGVAMILIGLMVFFI